MRAMACARSAASDLARAVVAPAAVEVVVYHRHCPDGFGAAWAAWRALEKEGGKRDVTFFAATHGDDTAELEAKAQGKNVAVFDFSFSKEVTARIMQSASSLVVLDHHLSAQEEHSGTDYACFDMHRSGAPLAWEYFFDREVPTFLRYIEDKDIWKWELEHSKEFSAGFGLVDMTFESFDQFYEDDQKVAATIENGKVLLALQKETMERYKRKSAIVELSKGVTVAVCNAGMWVSELGNQLAADADFALVWGYDHAKDTMGVSLRSLGFDVSRVARLYGGGGHAKAAGMRWDGTIAELLANLKEKDLTSSRCTE